jgi:hypothetical protein
MLRLTNILLAVVGEPPTNEKEYIGQNTSQTKR